MNDRIIFLGQFTEYFRNIRNMGDALQHYAIIKWLKRHYPLFEIKNIFYFTAIDELKEIIKPDDVIVFQSGGAMGDLYFLFEKWRLEVCDVFFSNRIILFPQTVFFRKEENILKTKLIYHKHVNLTIMARDYQSFNLLRQLFPKCHLLIMPDFVLFLKGDFNVSLKKDKNKSLLIFRNDFEINQVGQELAKRLISDYDSYDLVFPEIEHSVDMEKRDFVEEVFNYISSYDFVVTDRLHGMIFCVILGVPCICLPGSPEVNFYKNKATYESWFLQIPYIEFCENSEDELRQAIKKVGDYNQNLNPIFSQYSPSRDFEQHSFYSKEKSEKVRNGATRLDYLFNYYLPNVLGDLKEVTR